MKGWGIIGAGVWIAGIILAKGFWSTLAAVFLPLWDIYLVVDKVLHATGLVS